jgi:hypothetical protein
MVRRLIHPRERVIEVAALRRRIIDIQSVDGGLSAI